jgi:hypothetical protein
VKELERLRAARHASSALTLALAPGANALAGIRGDLFDLRAQFTVGNAGEVRFAIRGVPVVTMPRSRNSSAVTAAIRCPR